MIVMSASEVMCLSFTRHPLSASCVSGFMPGSR